MITLLKVDASPRAEGSCSRLVAGIFEQRWRALHPTGQVINRDLALLPVPHLTSDTILGFFSPMDRLTPRLREATATSDVLVNELLTADILLLSTPMYNFSVPSGLKAWIDQVVRVGYTFAIDSNGRPYGLLHGKKAVVVTAAGAAYAGTSLASAEHLQSYLHVLLDFLGFDVIECVSVENTAIPDLAPLSREAASAHALRLAAH